MLRRHFLTLLGAGGAGLALPVWASPVPSCRIIGIGGAGCNLALSLWSSEVLNGPDVSADFVCVDLGRQALVTVEAANKTAASRAPIRTIALAAHGAGGLPRLARAACWRNHEAIADMLAGAELVVLLAGLGGGTGSGAAPEIARWAKQAGAMTVAVVVAPFDFEGERQQLAEVSVAQLYRTADVVMKISNEDWSAQYRVDASIAEVFDELQSHIQWVCPRRSRKIVQRQSWYGRRG